MLFALNNENKGAFVQREVMTEHGSGETATEIIKPRVAWKQGINLTEKMFYLYFFLPLPKPWPDANVWDKTCLLFHIKLTILFDRRGLE